MSESANALREVYVSGWILWGKGEKSLTERGSKGKSINRELLHLVIQLRGADSIDALQDPVLFERCLAILQGKITHSEVEMRRGIVFL